MTQAESRANAIKAKINWCEPWCACPPGLENELYCEVGPLMPFVKKHILYKKKAISIGRRFDNDDVLFYLPDGPVLLAVVHLTWNGKELWDHAWPDTSLFNSVEEWMEEGMKKDAEEIL